MTPTSTAAATAAATPPTTRAAGDTTSPGVAMQAAGVLATVEQHPTAKSSGASTVDRHLLQQGLLHPCSGGTTRGQHAASLGLHLQGATTSAISSSTSSCCPGSCNAGSRVASGEINDQLVLTVHLTRGVGWGRMYQGLVSKGQQQCCL